MEISSCTLTYTISQDLQSRLRENDIRQSLIYLIATCVKFSRFVWNMTTNCLGEDLSRSLIVGTCEQLHLWSWCHWSTGIDHEFPLYKFTPIALLALDWSLAIKLRCILVAYISMLIMHFKLDDNLWILKHA